MTISKITSALQRTLRLTVLGLMPLLLAGCGEQNLKDGTFEAVSSEDEDGAYAKVELVIKDNQIIDCKYVTYEKSGQIKDENYGRGAMELGNSGFYERAQRAVAAMKIYRQTLLEVQDIDHVDKISGATIAYDQFTEAVHAALQKAAED